MQLEQVVVSSAYSRTNQQNRIISRSAGIDEQLAESILHWSPCGNDLAFGKPESINFFHPDGKTLALSRSVIGERQKSRDGGRHIVSHVVVCKRDQLEGYHNNVVLLTRMLRSMGGLILKTELPDEIPVLEIPDSTFFDPPRFVREEYSQATEKILHAIDIHHQVVIVGLKDPLEFLGCFFSDVSPAKRLQLSFATDLNTNAERPFALQFFAESDDLLEKELASRQLRTISLRSNHLVTTDY
jgi:hypothetical protein